MQLRDILAALDAAAADPKISSLVVVLDEMRPTGFATLREIAAAIDRFKASGKKVVAWGSSYDQRQYYIAAHADEVYLHPLGMVYIAGFGSLPQLLQGRARQARRHRQRDARRHLQERGRAVHRQRAVAARRSRPTALLYGGLWKTYIDARREGAQARRRRDHARASTRRRSASPRPAATPPSSRSPRSWSTA